MADRREYEMSEAQEREILKACEPVPYIVAGGIPPTSSQERANRAWQRLGREMGFDGMSVKPVPGKGARFFTAVAVDRAGEGADS